MSDLGDLIVEHPGAVLAAELKPDAVLALRDELIELRAIRASLPGWADAFGAIQVAPGTERGDAMTDVYASLREMRRAGGQ